MPRKRRLPKRRTRINALAIAAFAAGDEPALRRALELRPWEVSPLDVDDGPSPWPDGSAGAVGWKQAQELRRVIEAAIADSKT